MGFTMATCYANMERYCNCFCMVTNSFVCNIKTHVFYKDIAGDAKARFDTIGYAKEDASPFPIRKNQKIIGLMKGKLDGKIITELVALRAKLKAYKQLDAEKHEDK